MLDAIFAASICTFLGIPVVFVAVCAVKFFRALFTTGRQKPAHAETIGGVEFRR